MTPSVASNRLASNPAPGGSAGHHSSPSDIVLVTSSYDRTVRFWNPESLQSGIPYREIQHADSVSGIFSDHLTKWEGTVAALYMSPSSNLILKSLFNIVIMQ